MVQHVEDVIMIQISINIDNNEVGYQYWLVGKVIFFDRFRAKTYSILTGYTMHRRWNATNWIV